MNVQRALLVVPVDAVVTAEQTGKYGHAWNVVARCHDGYERVLTSFATRDPFSAARFVNEFDRCRQAA